MREIWPDIKESDISFIGKLVNSSDRYEQLTRDDLIQYEMMAEADLVIEYWLVWAERRRKQLEADMDWATDPALQAERKSKEEAGQSE